MHWFDIGAIEAMGRPIYDTALELITTHGMEVDDAWCRERILQTPGVSAVGKRVRFSTELIRELVPFGASEEGRFRFDYAEDSFLSRGNHPSTPEGERYRVGGFSLSVYDPQLGSVRPSTSADVEEALRLCHVLGIGGHYPCSVTDVPPPLRNPAAHFMWTRGQPL